MKKETRNEEMMNHRGTYTAVNGKKHTRWKVNDECKWILNETYEMNEKREWINDQREKEKQQMINENDKLLHEKDKP